MPMHGPCRAGHAVERLCRSGHADARFGKGAAAHFFMPARATFSNQPQIYEISNKQPSSPPLFFFRPPPRPPTFASAGANRGAIRRRVRCTLFMLIKVEEWAVESAKKPRGLGPAALLLLLFVVAYFAESAGAASAAGAAATLSVAATTVSVGVSTTATSVSATTDVVSALASLLPLPQDARDTAARATAKNMIFFIVFFYLNSYI